MSETLKNNEGGKQRIVEDNGEKTRFCLFPSVSLLEIMGIRPYLSK